MSDYRITVTNNDTESHKFFLYAECPTIQDRGILVFTAAMADKTIPPVTGNATFKFNHPIYGICGDEALMWGIDITGFDAAPIPIQLGQAGTPPVLGSTLKIYVTDGVAAFEIPEPPNAAGPGSFLVETGSDFNEGSNAYAGIASKSVAGTYTVEAAFQVDSSATYSVQPNFMYYIAIGNFAAGQVINVTEIGTPVPIIFPDGMNAVATTYLPNGTYTPPVYSKA